MSEKVLVDCSATRCLVSSDAETLLTRARRGDAQAQCRVGCSCWWGEDGWPKDDVQSRHWYTLAAEQGDCTALWNVATMYLIGEGGPVDVPRALAYLRRAATRRRWDFCSEDAAMMLAAIYQRGLYGVASDEAQAARWRWQERAQRRKFRGWCRRLKLRWH